MKKDAIMGEMSVEQDVKGKEGAQRAKEAGYGSEGNVKGAGEPRAEMKTPKAKLDKDLGKYGDKDEGQYKDEYFGPRHAGLQNG